MDDKTPFINVLISLGDDHLILGHRLSEWCGHAPMLEEDLSMPNMALDLLGQARNLYGYAVELEAKGRTEDDVAFLRSDREYKNILMVERPNGDFAHTILRQYYFAAYMKLFWESVLKNGDGRLQEFAAKATKELAYHIRHCGEWVVRLGDGTEESAARMKAAVDALHPYTNELFDVTPDFQYCIHGGLLPEPATLRADWDASVKQVFQQAFLSVPEVPFPQTGGRTGHHTEAFGHLLSELQYMQRAYPGLTW